jgi:hypothetical protein
MSAPLFWRWDIIGNEKTITLFTDQEIIGCQDALDYEASVMAKIHDNAERQGSSTLYDESHALTLRAVIEGTSFAPMTPVAERAWNSLPPSQTFFWEVRTWIAAHKAFMRRASAVNDPKLNDVAWLAAQKAEMPLTV